MTDGASGSEAGKLTLSSGGTALEGHFYQLDVSISTALDLVLAKKVARSVVLEPASEEDLEADVENAPSFDGGDQAGLHIAWSSNANCGAPGHGSMNS